MRCFFMESGLTFQGVNRTSTSVNTSVHRTTSMQHTERIKDTITTGNATSTKFSSKGPSKRSLKSQLAQPPYHIFNDDKLSSLSEKTFQEGIKNVAHLLHKRKKIIVLCGAGISVSCGIPDFRSKGGIYDMIDTNDLGLSTPEEIFHFEVFQDDPRPFYKFAGKMLYPNRPHEPSPSHKFLALLEEKKMLLRVYTQNIDGLEEKAGISPKKIVYAHGSLHVSTCLKCGTKVDTEELRDEVLKGNVPYCKKVVGKRRRRGEKTKRTIEIDGNVQVNGNENVEYEPVLCEGVMKPNITFFGEALVDRVRRCLEADQAKADAVIVIGTSLSVAPISKVIKYLRPSIPRILINRAVVIPKHTSGEDEDKDDEDGIDHRDGYLFDAILLGFCDEVTKAVAYVMENNDEGGRKKQKIEASKEKQEPSKTKKRKKIAQASGTEKKPFPFQSDDCKALCNDAKTLEAIGPSKNCLLNHPIDRILLFPGAKLEAQKDDDDDVTVYHEVVHCDECHDVIKDIIMKCLNCFDFDLCKKCHKKTASKHFEGKHKFISEK